MKRFLSALYIVISLASFSFAEIPYKNNNTSAKQNMENNVVRIGIFNLGNFQYFDAEGRPQGFVIKLLEKVSEYTGWEYKFTDTGNLKNAENLLRNREIDIMAPGIHSMASDDFSFSSYQICTDSLGIFTKKDRNTGYEDFDALSRMKIGLLDNEKIKESFFDYAKKNSFLPQTKYFELKDELFRAFSNNEVDCILTNMLSAERNTKLIANFNTVPVFFVMSRENNEISHELNKALSYIVSENPAFIQKLIHKFLNHVYPKPFTQAEKKFAKSFPPLKVGYTGKLRPFFYTDKISGEAAGIEKDIFELLASLTGLKFTFIEIPEKDEKSQTQFIKENKISLIPQIQDDFYFFRHEKLMSTAPFFISQKVFVGRKNEPFRHNEQYNVAIHTVSGKDRILLKDFFPNCSSINLPEIEQAFDSVLQKQTDFALVNSFIAEHTLKNEKYRNLCIVPKEIIEENTVITFLKNDENFNSSEEARMLLAILNKGIQHITNTDLSQIISKNSLFRGDNSFFSAFIYENRKEIGVIFGMVAFIILILIISIRQKAADLAKIKKRENQLQAITNNINGGVITLQNIDGMIKIVYCNKGFLNMIQYDENDMFAFKNIDFRSLIHPDDIKSVTEVAVLVMKTKEHFSLKFRIKRRDNTYIPIIANGTFVSNENNGKEQDEINCVLVDISFQEKLLEQLEQKKERYKLFLENSHDMYFDINLITGEVYNSSLIYRNFGDFMPKHYSGADFFNNWKIYKEDYLNFSTTLYEVFEHKEKRERKLRLNFDNSLTWYKISLMPVVEKDTVTQIIGRIENIDKDEKERKKILHQTQIDSLTGLYRKEIFASLAQKYLDMPHQKKSAMVFIDLDNFKKVNDTFGHLAGDEILTKVASKLQVIFSNYDIISRFGGDEFCILVKEIPLATLEEKLKWTLENLSIEYEKDNKKITVSTSIGVALSPDFGTNVSQLMQCADKALYESKKSGKNSYTFYK